MLVLHCMSLHRIQFISSGHFCNVLPFKCLKDNVFCNHFATWSTIVNIFIRKNVQNAVSVDQGFNRTKSTKQELKFLKHSETEVSVVCMASTGLFLLRL